MEKLVGELEQGMEKVQRAKQISLVRKGDVLLLSAVGSDGCNFWLLLCASICKRDGSINGKWLDRIGDGFEYRVIPCQDTTRENSSLPEAIVDEDMPIYVNVSEQQLLSHCLDS